MIKNKEFIISPREEQFINWATREFEKIIRETRPEMVKEAEGPCSRGMIANPPCTDCLLSHYWETKQDTEAPLCYKQPDN